MNYGKKILEQLDYSLCVAFNEVQNKHVVAQSIEKLSDSMAENFLQWQSVNAKQHPYGWMYKDTLYNASDLLQIFKKEFYGE